MNNDYWLERQRKLYGQTLDELNKLLISDYEYTFKLIYADMMDTYANIIGADDKPLMSHLYAYNRYYKLLKKINTRLIDLGSKEERYMNDYLTEMYEKNAKIVGEEFSLSTRIDEDRIREIANTD